MKEYPPLAKIGRLKVEQDVNVYTILNLDEVGGKFKVQFELVLKWFDPRLKMHNLRKQRHLNMLPDKEKSSIWVPTLTFGNTELKDFSLNDDFAYVTVDKLADFVRSSSEVINNVYIFEVNLLRNCDGSLMKRFGLCRALRTDSTSSASTTMSSSVSLSSATTRSTSSAAT